MLEHCEITFSWGTEFGKGGPILAARIGPGGPFLAADRFFRYRPINKSPKSGDSLHKTANSSSPDPFFRHHKEKRKNRSGHARLLLT